jgi:hypothetical protein
MILMFALFLVMTALIFRARRKGTEVVPGTLVALFMLWAGIGRFATDTLRVNDDRVLSLTGAQWMSLVMVPYGIYVLWKVRPAVRKLVGPDGKPLEPAVGLLDASDDDADADKPVPDELAPPEKAAASEDENGSAKPESEPADAADDEATAKATTAES